MLQLPVGLVLAGTIVAQIDMSKRVKSKEAGFISNELNRAMNKNEKIIMGILVGGIVVFLALSIILLFGKGKENVIDNNIPTTLNESSKKVNLSPYPTVPPIQNSTVMLNARRFNPTPVTIPKGGYIQFLNIDPDPITIEANDSNSSVLNLGAIAPGEYKQVTFNTSGTFTYKNKEKPSMTGIVIIQ